LVPYDRLIVTVCFLIAFRLARLAAAVKGTLDAYVVHFGALLPPPTVFSFFFYTIN